MIENWTSITVIALQNLWAGFLSFMPKLLGALIILIIGWIISIWVGKLISEILKRLKFDKIFEKTKWDEALEKADMKMSMSGFLGGLVKWILIIVFLLAAVEILGFSQFSAFVTSIVAWLPNLVVAAAIFVVAVVVADIAEKLIKAVVGKITSKYAGFVGSIVRWSIWIFALLAILSQLGVASDIIQILVSGFVALIVISSALAFGLGGKDVAREILEGMKNKLKS